jgi:hypothetical protein
MSKYPDLDGVLIGADAISANSQSIKDHAVNVVTVLSAKDAKIADLQHQLAECQQQHQPAKGSVYVFRNNCGFDDEAIAYAEEQGCTILPPMFYWGALIDDRNATKPSPERIRERCSWAITEDYDGPVVLDMENIPEGQQWFDRLRAKDHDARAFFAELIYAVKLCRPNVKVTFWGMPPLRHGWGNDFWDKIPQDWKQNRIEEAFWCKGLYDYFDWFMPEWYQWYANPDAEARAKWMAFFEDQCKLTRDLAGDRPVIPCIWTRCFEGPFRSPAVVARDDLALASRLIKQGVIDGIAIWSDPMMPFAHTKPYIDAAVNSILNPQEQTNE